LLDRAFPLEVCGGGPPDRRELELEIWLAALQCGYRELEADPSYIDHLLIDGGAKVQPIAEKTLNLVKEKIGLG
jgi:hypothetical protein